MIDYILSVFRCDYIAIHNAGSYCVVICSLGSLFCGVLAGMTLHAPLCCFVTNVFFGCRSDAIVDTLFVVCHAVYFLIFGISRQTDIHFCDCSCDFIEFFEFFWTAVDFDLRFPAHRRHMHNLYKMCSSKICPNAFVSERSFGVFATFVLFCINP